MKKIALSVLLLFCLTPLFAAKRESSSTQKLEVVNQKIQVLQKSLRTDKLNKVQLVNDLASTEKKIGKTAIAITRIDKKLSVLDSKLSLLEKQADVDKAKLDKQTLILQRELGVAYRMGQHEYVKLLLNQQNPSRVGRVMRYLDYISQARLEIMKAIKQTLASLSITQKAIQQKQVSLNQLKQKKINQKQLLEKYKKTRTITLAHLNHLIQSKVEKLSVLRANKRALGALVEKLQKVALRELVSKANFAKMRGRLPWPARGRLLKRFGAPIEHSHLLYNGVLIAAHVGQSVRAIYPGKVVFANWLSGYGLLIIVQHGRHYMTLYGHNQSLYKKKGDLVNEGDLLATVGNSGGNSETGLYFEIRHNGNAENPRHWCH